MSKAREKIIEAREIHLFDALDPEDGQRQFAVRFPTNPKFDSSVENSADLIFVVSGATNSNLRALAAEISAAKREMSVDFSTESRNIRGRMSPRI